jgi:hypothetical protein
VLKEDMFVGLYPLFGKVVFTGTEPSILGGEAFLFRRGSKTNRLLLI